MSAYDAFRPWRWDREDKAANRQALTIDRHGHRIVCDHRGLLIDGQRIDTTPVYDAAPETALVLQDDGRLIYRGRAVARLHPRKPGTANPGRLDLLAETSSPRHTSPRRSAA